MAADVRQGERSASAFPSVPLPTPPTPVPPRAASLDLNAIDLFRELADRSLLDREAYYAEHQVTAALRADVESLLRFDGTAGDTVHDYVAAGAEGVLLEMPEELCEGREVGPYRLVRELGCGGMGTVWIAHRTDGTLKRPVALKLLRMGHLDRQLTERFARERDILAALTHPNIARLYDAGVAQSGQPYLALEYVEGETLTAYADTHRLDLRGRIALFLQVLDAVQYAHRNLVLHRDLKPGNILVSADDVVHLLDFGIAKLLDGEQAAANATELTQQGGNLLTPEFASPEQIAGIPLTTASDVYSLGVILYELSCGQRPYQLKRGSRAELEEAILTAEPAPPSRATPDRRLARLLKGDLDTIVLKALKKDPADRYSTAEALSRDLRRFLDDEPVEARPDSHLYRLSKFVGRHRAAVSVAAAVVIVILTSLVFALVQMREARAQRDAAIFEARRAEGSLELTKFLVGEARLRPGDPSVAERFAKSRDILREQFAGEPEIRAELLFEISYQLAELRDLKMFGEVLDEIGSLVRQTGLPWLEARYRCASAELKMLEGETEAAAPLLREAFVHLARARPPHFGATIECLVDDSYHASMSGDFPRAIDRGREALRLHEERGLTNRNSYADAWSALETAYSWSGDVRNALHATRKKSEVYERLGQDDTFSYLTSLTFQALFLHLGGQRTEALSRNTDVLERSKAQGLTDNLAPRVFRAPILVGVEQPGQAFQLYDELAIEFAQQKMQFDELSMHIGAADALVRLGKVPAARARLDAHWPAIEEQIAANNSTFTKGLRVRASLLEAEGRLPEARATIERAVAIIAASKSPTYSGATGILRSAGELALATGDAVTARAHIEQALERAARDAIDPAASADIGECLLTRARILRALGRIDEASRDTAAAAVHFRTTLPPDHPLVREAAAGTH